MDEPWSRPGDYVLLKAMNDLVCASSSCPDDIDPANGWQITPIHVRVYAPDNTFSVAIAHRVTADADPVLTRETTFHPRTSELTKSFVEYRGFWLPHCFDNEGAIAEYWACREKVAIMDLSPLRKWEVLGPDAEALIQRAITRDARRLSVGQVTYTAVCNETGGMIDDATVYRLGEDNFRFVGGDEYDGVWLKELADRHELKVWVKPSTTELHNVAVQGPESRELLKKIVWTPPTQTSLEDLKWFRFTVGRIGTYDGIPIVVSRTGYTGELGYEVWCHPSDGPAVWDAIWSAGEEHGLTPLGLEALDILRIESGLIFAGYEFDDQVDPFEAGIGFAVDLKTDDDFVGRAALEERHAHPQRVLVGLELEGNETAGHGDEVYVGRQRVGVVTSGTRSPILKKNIALARVAVQVAELGTALEVGKLDGLQKRIPRRSSASRSTTRTRLARVPERELRRTALDAAVHGLGEDELIAVRVGDDRRPHRFRVARAPDLDRLRLQVGDALVEARSTSVTEERPARSASSNTWIQPPFAKLHSATSGIGCASGARSRRRSYQGTASARSFTAIPARALVVMSLPPSAGSSAIGYPAGTSQ